MLWGSRMTGALKDTEPALSVIIPVGPNEPSQPEIIQDLAFVPKGSELIFVLADERQIGDFVKIKDIYPQFKVIVTTSRLGRACQQNSGARKATGDWLWFLHADSRLGLAQTIALQHAIGKNPGALLYFNLSFLPDGPPWMVLNATGVWVRSHWLKLPFGDQGFCLQKDTFDRIGRFDESIEEGEDYFFVRAATNAGVKIICTGSTLQTSARKYDRNGWLNTTGQHLLWTVRQTVRSVNGKNLNR